MFTNTQKTCSFGRSGWIMDIHPITHKLVLFTEDFIGEMVPKELPIHVINHNHNFRRFAIATLNIINVTWHIFILLMKHTWYNIKQQLINLSGPRIHCNQWSVRSIAIGGSGSMPLLQSTFWNTIAIGSLAVSALNICEMTLDEVDVI